MTQQKAANLTEVTFDELADRLSVSISKGLSHADETLSPGGKLRSTLRNLTGKILRQIVHSDETCLIFAEAIPGYTVVSYRKKDMFSMKGTEKNDGDGEEDVSTIFSEIMENHFTITGISGFSVEMDELMIGFFPLKEARKSLREMGYAHLA